MREPTVLIDESTNRRIDRDSVRREYMSDGFVLIGQYPLYPSIFSTQEIESLRAACATYTAGDILSKSAFSFLPLDDRILMLVRAMIGDRIVYFGESTALYNAVAETPQYRHYHNDSRGDDFDFSMDYSVIRVGIYLQDHARHSGGLKLRPGSHRKFCMEKNGFRSAVKHLLKRRRPHDFLVHHSLNVETTTGSILAWNMRIHHTGYARRLRRFPNFALHPHVENLLPDGVFMPEERERCVVFMTFGAPSGYLEMYIENRVNRQDMRNHWRNTHFTDEAVDLARRKGVTLRMDGVAGQ